MNDSKPGPAPTEMLFDWEGPAVLNPAAFADHRMMLDAIHNRNGGTHRDPELQQRLTLFFQQAGE